MIDKKRSRLKGQHVVIIGNGIAGNSALSAIRSFDSDAKVTLISEEEYPLYSPCAFYKYLAGEMERRRLFLKTVDDYSREKIGVVFGHKVSEVDVKARKVFVEYSPIHFDHLILATGSRALFPPINGIEKRGVFALKTMSDAESILNYPAKKVLIVGSGPIGIESAIAFRKRGLEVSVIEILDRVLPRLFDDTPAGICRKTLEDRGIEILTEERVIEILGDESVTGVATDKHEIPCDMVVMGAGVNPNTELARAIGLDIGTLGGIRADDFMLTNVEGIYACGDCIEAKDIVTRESTLSLLWANAKRQGWTAGCNCVGERRRFPGSFDATVIEMYGTYAVCAGKGTAYIENRDGCEVIEGMSDQGYYRLIILDNSLVGMQMIDTSEHAGFFFSKMLRKDDVKELRRIALNDKLLSVRHWNYLVSKYMTPRREVISG